MATYKVCDENGSVITRDLSSIDIPITGRVLQQSDILMSFGVSGYSFTLFQEFAYFGYNVWQLSVATPDFNLSGYAQGVIDTPGTSVPMSGSFTFSGAHLELRCDYGGSSWANDVPDGVPYTGARFYWYLPAGQHVDVTAKISPFGTATASGMAPEGEWTDEQSVVLSTIARPHVILYPPPAQVFSGDTTLSLSFPSVGDVGALNRTFTDEHGGTCYADLSGGSATVASFTPNASAFFADGPHAQVMLTAKPAISFDVPYSIKTIAGEYPDTLSISAIRGDNELSTPQIIDATSGDVTATQESYKAQVDAGTESGSSEKHTYGPISLSIVPSSLAANGEDYVVPAYGVDTTPRITRLPIRAGAFPAVRVTHDASYPLPDWSSLGNWSGNGGATVAFSAENIVITTGDSAGGATFAYPVDPDNANLHHAVSGLSYRFLNVTTPEGAPSPYFNVTIPPCSVYIDPNSPPPSSGFVPDAPGSIGPPEDVYSGLETPSKRWDVKASATGLQGCGGDIDLCGPDYIAFGTSAFQHLADVPGVADGTIPLDRGTRWPIPSRMMPCQGVWRIERIIINDIPANSVLTISSLMLRRRNQPTYDCLDQWNRGRHIVTSDSDYMEPDWESGQTSAASSGDDGDTHTSHYERRGVLSLVDGKQAVEEAVFWYSYFEGLENSYDLFIQESIATLIARINARDGELGIYRYPGVTATSLCPVPSNGGYGCTDAMPCCPNDSAPAAWLCNHDTSMGVVTDDSTGIAKLYARPLFDQVTPCFGMDWSQFKAIAVLRGTAQGLVVAAADSGPDVGKYEPQVGVPVQLIEVDDVPAGSAGTNRGTGTTSSCGFYSTAAPCGRGPNVSHKVVSNDTTPHVSIPFSGINWRARYRHRATMVADYKRCNTTLLGDPLIFSPFTPQFSDPNAIPNEEWRRIGGSSGFGETDAATTTDVSGSVGDEESNGDTGQTGTSE